MKYLVRNCNVSVKGAGTRLKNLEENVSYSDIVKDECFCLKLAISNKSLEICAELVSYAEAWTVSHLRHIIAILQEFDFPEALICLGKSEAVNLIL